MEKKQKEQLKKILIYSGIGLLFTLSMWFIFRPSEKSGTEERGLNKELPQATVEQLPENKLKVYEIGEHLEQEEISRSEMGQLSDYFERQGEETDDSEHTSSVSKVASSMERYEENSRLLSFFYDYDPREEEREAMQAEIEELRARLEAQESEQDEEEKQLALMEKSYQMAAKYMTQATPPSNSPSATNAKEETSVTSASTTLPEVELMPERKHLVSSLEQPMTDSAFIAEYAGRERNLGFHSLSAQRPNPLRNTLRCVVDRTTTLQEGDIIVLRLTEGARLHTLSLPRYSRIVAQAKIEGNRMRLLVQSIEIGGYISSVKLSAYDTDGQEGIYIPGSENLSALKEMGANIGGTAGTSFTFASSAKDQIISDVARGVMQGASQLLQKKLRTVKVTLKGGYRLYLLPTQ
ncbi:conjugal transfer protein TraM [Porphyromonas canoris]|uniref:conjugative transposon protein TraM n=1 Tax=Porphyromonas canoris TaxID=36875 RepID=UPI00051D8C59|nr:conjugative transposon protein TraM [Porphyromonas canoris]KGL51786.1 conjugal transfer protein TraM [Porphyromonas canoris]